MGIYLTKAIVEGKVHIITDAIYVVCQSGPKHPVSSHELQFITKCSLTQRIRLHLQYIQVVYHRNTPRWIPIRNGVRRQRPGRGAAAEWFLTASVANERDTTACLQNCNLTRRKTLPTNSSLEAMRQMPPFAKLRNQSSRLLDQIEEFNTSIPYLLI